MTTQRVDTNRPEYSWIPFFEELARKLYEGEYWDQQPAMVAELKRMKSEGLVIAPWVDNLTDWIDPFSLFGTLRRVGFDNAVPIMELYKAFFDIDADLPVEDMINPSLLAQSSFFFTGVGDNGQVDIHWELFRHVISTNRTASDSKLAELINQSIGVSNVGFANLSGALFWIKPHEYLKTDTIAHYLKTWEYSDFGRDYLHNLDRIHDVDDRPFPTLNVDEWLTSEFLKNPDKSQIWQVRCGAGFTEFKWFRDDGLTAVDFALNDVNMSITRTREEHDQECLRVNPDVTNYVMGEVWRFANEIKRGDLVVMPWEVNSPNVLYGFAPSAKSYFTPDTDGFRNRRSVLWKANSIDTRDLNLPGAGTVLTVEASKEKLSSRIIASEGGRLPESDVANDPYTVTTMLEEGVFAEKSDLARILNLLQRKRNLILQGPPGTGKTFLAKRLAYALMEERADERVASVQFHQSYSYEDFVGGYRPGVNAQEQLVFTAQDGAFLRLCDRARASYNEWARLDPEDKKRQSPKKFVMLIDEINRGNLSRVFGELLMLIEADKRSPEHAVELQHRRVNDVAGDDDDAKFYVPENVYIIGTMNLADRSLTGMNVAMRRRFGFAELKPQFNSPQFVDWIDGETAMPSEMRERIQQRMKALNDAIEGDASLGRQYAVGHSFFCPDSDMTEESDWEAWYKAVVNGEIRQLLEEYWFDDAKKAEDEVDKLL